MSDTSPPPHATINDGMLREYLTESQFCERYQISRRTAERWRVTGDGPKWCRLGPRKVAYRLSDCEAWAAARTFAHRAAELSAAQ
jgi:predicted DNA-binding transcriptional regulator AlpA